jgi:Transmembrane secretion effector
LIPLIGVSFIFGGNGVGFLVMFLVILGWQRLRTQSKLPLENFFESLTTAIRYVRYSPGIKILLARHALFSFFISIIPSLMPVLGLTELHLPASHLGYLFTSQAVGSVRRFHHSAGPRPLFAATHYDLRQSHVGVQFLSDGFSASAVCVLSGRSACRYGMDPV